MGITNVFDGLFNFGKEARTIKRAEQIRGLTREDFWLTHAFASEYVKKNIPVWDISNCHLWRYLGYIAGILDGAAYATGRSKYDDLAIDMAFHGYMVLAHSDMPNVPEFLCVDELSIQNRLKSRQVSSGFIGGLQRHSSFVEAQLVGGRDYLDAINLGDNSEWPPKGLLSLFAED